MITLDFLMNWCESFLCTIQFPGLKKETVAKQGRPIKVSMNDEMFCALLVIIII